MQVRRTSSDRGFTLIDMMVVMTIIAIVSTIALPSMLGAMDRMQLGQDARQVERELQTAKARAVVKGRTMRVRFDCTVVGEYRTVELIGTTAVPVAADAAANRCDQTVYPYPADDDPATTPNLDGPTRRVDDTVSFTASPTIEFRPNGMAFYEANAGDFDLIPVAGIEIRLERYDVTATITVNGLGKIELQQ